MSKKHKVIAVVGATASGKTAYAIELAKKFDHDKAPSFINGVVNKIAENEGLKG